MGCDIITCCPADEYNGVVAHLQNMDDICNFTKFIPLSTTTYNIWKVVKQIKDESPKLIIFGGAWNTWYDNISLVIKKDLPHIKIGILHCSPFGQTEISNEVKFLKQNLDLCKEGVIDYVFSGSKHMENLKGVIWLPQTLKLIDAVYVGGKRNGVGLFNSFTGYKNILNQVVGYKLSNIDDPLYINREDDTYLPIIESITKVAKMGFVKSRKDFLTGLCGMKMLLHCSFSESYAYMVAEAHRMGVPCIVSQCLKYWVPIQWREYLVVNDNDCPVEIGDKIKRINSLALDNYTSLCSDIILTAREVIGVNNEYTTSILKRLLNKISSK